MRLIRFLLFVMPLIIYACFFPTAGYLSSDGAHKEEEMAILHHLSQQNYSNSTTSSSACRVLIMNQLFDFHYEILESVALRYPLPWNNLNNCSRTGYSELDPIRVDFFLCFKWHNPRRHKRLEAWGWKQYFEQQLEGTIRQRPRDGRFIQFGAIVGRTEDQYSQLTWSYYSVFIEATCDSHFNRAIWWMKENNSTNFCILHSFYDSWPSELAARTCWLNPQFEPQCWFLPTDYPKFPRPTSPSQGQPIRLCIPPLRSRRNATALAMALFKHTPRAQLIVIGRKAKVPLILSNLSSHVTLFNKLAFLPFQQRIASCHVLIPLVEPEGYTLRYFGNDSRKLSGFVSQAIGNGIPAVLHSAVVAIYGPYLKTPYFEYNDTQTFLAAFDRIIDYYGQRDVIRSSNREIV